MKLLDTHLFEQLGQTAITSPRRRSHHNLHPELSDPVQRLCINLQPDTYLRPHAHRHDFKWELMLILTGTVALLTFDDDGVISRREDLAEQGEVKGAEIPPHTWHTVLPIDGPATILEIKQGPYMPIQPEDFAPWAPEEGSDDAGRFIAWAVNAAPGSRYSLGY